MTRKPILLGLLLAAVYLLHQDFWNWGRLEPLVFGFMPVGLAYHVGYSLVAAVVMVILVRFAWPRQLDDEEQKPHAPSKEAKP